MSGDNTAAVPQPEGPECLLDGFAAEVRRQLAELIEDGAEGEELRDTLVVGVESLLTCHWCGTVGMPPCGCDDDEEPAQPSAAAHDVPQPEGTERAKVIVLCGSTRFRSEFESWNSRLTLLGYVVLSVGVFGHGYHPYHREKYLDPKKPMLDRLHLQKIDMADEVFVIDPGGYVGESTSREIEYARQQGKPVRFLSQEDPTCTVCGRDNRNGTHTALERVGHLSHPFTPPDAEPAQPSAAAHDEPTIERLAEGAHLVTVVYDFQGRALHSCLNCHYAGFSPPPLPCPGRKPKHAQSEREDATHEPAPDADDVCDGLRPERAGVPGQLLGAVPARGADPQDRRSGLVDTGRGRGDLAGGGELAAQPAPPVRDGEAEALAGLDQWRTGPGRTIFVVQEHQLLDWLAARDAAQRAEGARDAVRIAQKVPAGEDTVEWARGARASSLALSYAIELLDDLLADDDLLRDRANRGETETGS